MRRLSVFRRRVGTSAAPDASTVAAKLQNDVSNVAARIVPWFTSRMPPQYFRLVSEQAQQRHLRALVGLAVSDRQWRERSGTQHWSVPEISLHHRNGGWTYISDGTEAVVQLRDLAVDARFGLSRRRAELAKVSTREHVHNSPHNHRALLRAVHCFRIVAGVRAVGIAAHATPHGLLIGQDRAAATRWTVA